MFDCHKHLKALHDDRVTLTNDMKQKMRDRRDANQKRMARGLEKAGKPKVLRHVKQGSYAMHTMVQSEFEASDIDDGAIFAEGDLVGPKGGAYTPLDAKNMVRDALDDGSFKKAPEVRTNCVRVYYNDGFTLDIPVYREATDLLGDTYYELASTNWKKSDPEGVTQWFNTQVMEKSPDENNGRQMRRIVRLLKAWCKSRKSWNMPSGFILSKLTDEVYSKDVSLVNRDDQALLQVMEAIRDRLNGFVGPNLVVNHPVFAGKTITKTDKDADMVELHSHIKGAVSKLSVLRSSDCTELDAIKALRDVFNTNYFDDRIEELENDSSASKAAVLTATGSSPTGPVIKKGGEGRYA